AKIDGRNVYLDEMQNLRNQRNIASEFMRGAVRVAMFHVEEVLKDPKQIEESKRPEMLRDLQGIAQHLNQRLVRPRYFEGGAKLALIEPQTGAYQQRVQDAANIKLPTPIEARAPLSPAQMWDEYKARCGAHDIDLLPISVAELTDKVPAPTELDLKSLFEQYRT